MTVPTKCYFRYFIGLSEPTTGALSLGKAFHGTLAQNSRKKMNKGRDIETGELTEVINQEWSPAMAEAVLREDTTELATTGQVLVAAYLAEAAPSVKPRPVEQTLQGQIASVNVREIVDLLDVGGYCANASAVRRPSSGITLMASRRPRSAATRHLSVARSYPGCRVPCS